MTLEELLEKYPSFEEEEKTLYVSADSLNVRTSPNADNSNNLVQPGLVKKDEVKVMATGLVDGKLWSIIEYSEGVYHFVRTSYLTPNSNGEVVITLAELLEKNTEFTEQTETKATATQKTYGFTSLASNPTTADAAIEIASGTSVTIVASGSKYEANWYIIEDSEGMYYFVFAEFFTTSASVG